MSIRERSERHPRPGFTKLEVAVVAAVIVVLIALLLPAAQQTRDGGPRNYCKNHLKQLGLAFHNYHDNYKMLPAHAYPISTGRLGHSWRTMLLPYLDQAALYDEFNFDKAWNDPANVRITDTDLIAFQCHQAPHTFESETNYLVNIGDDTAFPPGREIALDDITDGTSNTLLVFERSDSGIAWAEPQDFYYDEAQILNSGPPGFGLSSVHEGGGQVALTDGSVRFLADKLSPEIARRLILRNDGEEVGDF
ncbi:DUF1559 family PulG-like putative transporter [Stratiformator vulcanicus]|uniref:DUF1559 domain-containing protein n=1 Tax=Stratiformator vulcanicus TaxID=2527980 RepID=A0A517QYX3_9PLAN|nr:DUF1559 domain-containing protein [Stratiformator vulcanicus]QDT36740.1 hypothetical protein Pan189_11030 [Stratiformator vulcanicus]